MKSLDEIVVENEVVAKRLSHSGPQTLEEALKEPSTLVWPGCGDGRCMPCGGVQNRPLASISGPPIANRFRCMENSENGCPKSFPEQVPKFNLEKRKCSGCGTRAGYVTPTEKVFKSIAAAKEVGFPRWCLVREGEEPQ